MPEVVNYTASQVNIPAALVANGLGVCLMLTVMLTKRRRVRMTTCDGKIFLWMCRICLTLCVLESAGFLLDGKNFTGARPLAIFLNSFIFLASVFMAYLWICYVDFKMFESYERLRRLYLIAAIPVMAICVLLVVNLFVELFFGVTQENVYYRATLVWLPYVVVFGYMTSGAVLVFRHRKRTNKYLFLPVLAFLIPIYLGTVIQLLCYGLALIFASVSLGLTLLYINLQNEENFLDPLTNLYNRNYLLHYIDHIRRQVDKGKQVKGIMLDINGFKQINDTLGHVVGDHVLQAVGAILLQATDSGSVVVRYGGDEFVILVEDADQQRIQSIRENIQRGLDEYNASEQAPYTVSLSAGVAEFRSKDFFMFFQEMDRNMYADKRAFYLR